MRVDDLTIVLRTRSAWEATDLGIALVRRHARTIFAAWVIVTLPLFCIFNLVAFALGLPWLAVLAMWWLKPLFDRIPLYVLSRAVFGEVPSLRQTLQAQRAWGWRGIAPWLLWRRLHPGRAMLLAVDLLEGQVGAQRTGRVRVLARGGGSPNVMLTIIGAHLETMLGVSIVLFGLMFVPAEFLSESAKAVWDTLVVQPPPWAELCANACAWIATTIVEPFYVGAGFGLYLNRRVQLEGWDIELAFRRIARRLAGAAAVAIAVWMLALSPVASAADAAPTPPAGTESASTPVQTLPAIFGESYRDDGAAFEDAARRAYDGGDLSPKRQELVWKLRHAEDDAREPASRPAWLGMLGETMGFIARFAAWILLAALLVALAFTHRRWMPWLAAVSRGQRALDPLRTEDASAPAEPLPDDVPAAVRALLRADRARDALALLYRASVDRLSAMLAVPLPPGATESECLRRARALPDAREGMRFARVVRGWQAAAYAQRAPAAADIEAMLGEWDSHASGPAA